MADLDKAIAAARELHHDPEVTYSAYWFNEYQSRMGDLLAAIDAARGEAVATVRNDTGLTLTADRLPHYRGQRIPRGALVYAAPPAAVAVPAEWVAAVQEFVDRVERGEIRSKRTYAKFKALLAQQPAALAVPADNVTPMRQPRADLARLVESINAAVYANGDGLSVTEAIGALELAKLELLKEQEQ